MTRFLDRRTQVDSERKKLRITREREREGDTEFTIKRWRFISRQLFGGKLGVEVVNWSGGGGSLSGLTLDPIHDHEMLFKQAFYI